MASSTKKILFFDVWTKGIHNFARLSEGLKQRGVSTLLVHLGSWGSEVDRPKEEILAGITCRDIRFYGTRFIQKVLYRERPDLVLLLNDSFIADRAVILGARSLGVLSAYLMHGHIEIGSERDDFKAVRQQHHLIKRWKRLGKYLEYTLPNYWYSGWKCDRYFPFRLSPYRLVLKTFLDPYKETLFPSASPELHCDLALVWANIYKNVLVGEIGYPKDRVMVVGHPPLDDLFSSSPSEMGCDLRVSQFIQDHPGFALYIEGSLVEAGFSGWTSETRAAHVLELAELARSAGRGLLVKLHPATEPKDIEIALSGKDNALVVRDSDLTFLTSRAGTVITHLSTASTPAVCLGKPVLVPRWGVSSSVPDFLIRRGAALAISSPQDMTRYLRLPETAVEQLSEPRKRFLDEYVTFLDGRSCERIVNAIDALISTRKARGESLPLSSRSVGQNTKGHPCP